MPYNFVNFCFVGQILFNPKRLFAVHHGKGFVSTPFQVSIDHLDSCFESGKRNHCLETEV